MPEESSLITVVFTKVKDADKLDELINNAVGVLVVYKLIQNNGIAAYVINGIAAENAETYFRGILKEIGMTDVGIVVSRGNAFSR